MGNEIEDLQNNGANKHALHTHYTTHTHYTVHTLHNTVMQCSSMYIHTFYSLPRWLSLMRMWSTSSTGNWAAASDVSSCILLSMFSLSQSAPLLLVNDVVVVVVVAIVDNVVAEVVLVLLVVVEGESKRRCFVIVCCCC